MRKICDLTVVQEVINDTFHQEGKSQRLAVRKVQFFEAIHRKITERANCGRKRYTTKRDDRCLEKF